MSGSCSRLSTVSSSFVGGIEISGSASVEESTEMASATSAGAESVVVASGCDAASLVGSLCLVASTGLQSYVRKGRHASGQKSTYFSAGTAAFFGAGAGVANMLAQLFLTPSGIMLDAALAAVVDGASVAAAPQLSLAAGCSSSVGAAPHAADSTVGTDGSMFSLREPLVCAVDAPRPRPPLPRSAARLRPLPLSVPARPPRETLLSLVESPKVETVASLALDRDLSFFVFETSPHCVIDPAVGGQHATSKCR